MEDAQQYTTPIFLSVSMTNYSSLVGTVQLYNDRRLHSGSGAIVGTYPERDHGGHDEDYEGGVVEAVDEQLHPRLRVRHRHPIASELASPLLKVVVGGKPMGGVALQHYSQPGGPSNRRQLSLKARGQGAEAGGRHASGGFGEDIGLRRAT